MPYDIGHLYTFSYKEDFIEKTIKPKANYLHNNIDNVVCSDHFPLCIEVICDIIPLYNSTMTSAVNSSIKWHAAKDSDKLQYMIKSEELA